MLGVFLPMVLGSMICMAMFGSGVLTPGMKIMRALPLMQSSGNPKKLNSPAYYAEEHGTSFLQDAVVLSAIGLNRTPGMIATVFGLP
jgi:hypothetical protein